VSKALEISILKATLPLGIFLESMLMASEVIPIQSFMCRPLIKPFWLEETILAAMEANLLAKIFEMILNLKFATVIGWRLL